MTSTFTTRRKGGSSERTEEPEATRHSEPSSSAGVPLFLQKKMSVGQPGDAFEQEADRVAGTMIYNPSSAGNLQGGSLGGPRKCGCAGSSSDECEECRQKREQVLPAPSSIQRRDADGATGASDAPPIVHEALRSSGQPLDASVRPLMENHFGRDFGAVRVHTDAVAAKSAQAVNALAYTAGSDVVFAPGQYAPGTGEGQQLLAHELTHVAQQDAGDVVLRRHPEPPPLARPRSDWYWYRDVPMSTDPAFMKQELRGLISRRGLKGGDEWYNNLLVEQGVPPKTSGLGISATTSAYGPRVRSPLDMRYDMQEEQRRQALPEAVPLAFVTYLQVRWEAMQFLADFEDRAKANAKQTLEANRLQTNREATRYGLTGEMLEIDTEDGSFEVPNFQMEGATPANTGLQDAANILLQRRQKIEEKKSERDDKITVVEGMVLIDDSYWPLDAEVKKMETDYKDLQSYVSDQYPILGRYSEPDASLDALQTIATKGAGTETANLIGAQVTETLRNIKDSEEGLDDGDVNVWRLDAMVDVTQQTMNVAPGSMEGRLVRDKVEEEKPGWLQGVALAVLNIAALLLAGPTGGLSLVVAAGVNIAVTTIHIQEYMLQKALAGSALQKERALSQEDPSLFWLAVEIVGTAFDVGTAASAMLKAFHALAPVVKAAEAAEGTEKAAESLELVSKTADDVGLAGKTKDILAHIKAGPGTEEEVIKDIAKGEGEAEKLKSLAKTGAEEEEVARKAAQSVELEGGGKVTVTKTGDIWSCASPCRLLRERYAGRLSRQPEWEAKIADLEKRAAQIPPGAEGDAARRTLAAEAAKMEQEIRTTALPGDWTPAVKDDPNFNEMVKRRGSVAPELDRHPPNWSGREEANFRYGASAEPEAGYTWALGEDGKLVYKRTGFPPDLPPRRFNPASGTFEEAAEGEAITRAKFTPGADETKELDKIAKAEKDKMEELFKNRRKLMSERDRLEDLQAKGALADKDSKALSKLYAEINEQSRLLGENAAEAVMRGKGGVRVYPIGKAYSTAGDFDQVWKVGDEFYVIEAKGGSGGLGTRMVGGIRAEQGTGEYFGDIARNMSQRGATKEIRQLGDQLLAAQVNSKLKYMLVRAPIGTEKGAAVLRDIQVREFVLAAP